jgi:structural maintenance of chromosome 2
MFQMFSEYGLDSHDVQDMLACSPYLFNHSPQDKVRPCLEWLELQLGLSRQQVAEVVRRFPAVLGYGVKSHLVPHMAYLKSLGVSEQQLPELVLERPYVLGAGIETLVQYLTKELRIKRTHCGTLLRHFPFDYSLQFLRFPPLPPPQEAPSSEGSSSDGDGSNGSDSSSSGSSDSSSSDAPQPPSTS